jgi:hypothetical protein
MTLILTFASPFYVLQVSDRLVTVSGKEFDAVANKNVIYLARDADATIGYTGRAFVDRVPTDQWIAEKLGGSRAEGERPRKPAIRFTVGPIPKWPKLAQPYTGSGRSWISRFRDLLLQGRIPWFSRAGVSAAVSMFDRFSAGWITCHSRARSERANWTDFGKTNKAQMARHRFVFRCARPATYPLQSSMN